jgi:hypothetical protein
MSHQRFDRDSARDGLVNEVLQIQLAPVSFYNPSDRFDLLAMPIHISNGHLATSPDWLAAQSGHTPHGVTVMGAYRQSPSQPPLRRTATQVAEEASQLYCPAFLTLSVAIYRRHANTRCGLRYQVYLSWKDLLRTSRKRMLQRDDSKNGIQARAPVPMAFQID